MISINIDVDPAQVQDVRERLAYLANGANRALSRALNKTASKGKTLAIQGIRRQINLSAAYVRERLKGPADGWEYKATVNKLEARISTPRRGVLLYQFSTNPVAATGRPPGLIKVKVAAAGRTLTIPSAFWVWTKNSHKLTPAVRNEILRRLGMTRTLDKGEFTVLHGPSLSQVFTGVKDDISADLSAVLAANLLHEMEWLLQKYPPPGDDGSSET